MEQLDVGLVGYGMAGEIFHAPVITAVPGLRLKSIVERHQQRSQARYPEVNIVRSVTELVADPEIALVVVATPNTSHYDIAHEALSAGKHVVIDKPFTNTTADADKLMALAQEQGLLLSVFQNRRWDGDFLTVKKILQEGLLGRLVAYESAFDRFHDTLQPDEWREKPLPGSGLLFDLGSHLIDQAVQLFGLPASVTADVRHQRRGAQADDDFEVRLGYENVKVTLQASNLARRPRPRFRLFGTAGSYLKYGLDTQEAALQQDPVHMDADWGREPAQRWGTIDTSVGDLHLQGQVETVPGRYQAYYENVRAAIVDGEPLAVTAEQARNVIRIIELAQQSQQEQRTIPCSW